MNIAQQLKHLMQERGLSSSKLAREIHVHTSTVSNWLDGKDVKTENLAALCEYFGCSLDYLADSTAETKKTPTQEGERKVSDDDIMFALWGDSDDVDKDDLDDVKRYAAFVRERKKKK